MVKLKRNEVVKEEVSKRINFALQKSVAQVEERIKKFEPLLNGASQQNYLAGAYSLLGEQKSRLSHEIAYNFDKDGIDFLIKPYVENISEAFLAPVILYLDALERKFAHQTRSLEVRQYQFTTKVLNKLVELTGQGKIVKSIDIIKSIEGADAALVRATLKKIRSHHKDELNKYGIVAIGQKSGFLYRREEKSAITSQ